MITHSLSEFCEGKMVLKLVLVFLWIPISFSMNCDPCTCYNEYRYMQCSGESVRSLRMIQRKNQYWYEHAKVISLSKTEVYDIKILANWTSLRTVFLDRNTYIQCKDIHYLLKQGLEVGGNDVDKCQNLSTGNILIIYSMKLIYS